MTNLDTKAKFYKSLSEAIRLKIIAYILKKDKCTCICELSKLLKKDQSVIFRHIIILKKTGILSTKKEGKYLMCCVKDKNKIKRILEG